MRKILGIVAVLVLALGFRLYNLTLFPIFADEAIYIRWAQVMRAEETLRFLPLSDGKQPLFMWTTIPFLKIFSDPLLAGRIVSVLSGIGSLLGIFFLANLLFKSKKVALLAATIYLFSPFTLFFDRMALVDSMLSMFGIWTVFFSLLSLKNLRFDFAILAGFSLGFAHLTKSPSLFFTFLTLFIFVLWFVANKSKGLVYLIKLVGLLLTILLISYGVFNILRLGPNFHMIALRNQDYVYPFKHIFINPFDPTIPHLKDISVWFLILGPFPIIFLFPLGLYESFKKNRHNTLILLAWFVFPILVNAIYAKGFNARYILYTVPALIILVSASLLNISKKVKIYFKTFLGIFILISLLQDFFLLTDPAKMYLPRSERSGYLEEWTSGVGLREISNYLKKEAAKDPEKTIVVGVDGYFGTLPEGLQIYFDKSENVKIVGVGITISEVPQSLLESKKVGNKAYLVIDSSRFKGDEKKMGLKLVNSYPKATKPDGTFQSMLFYELEI